MGARVLVCEQCGVKPHQPSWKPVVPLRKTRWNLGGLRRLNVEPRERISGSRQTHTAEVQQESVLGHASSDRGRIFPTRR